MPRTQQEILCVIAESASRQDEAVAFSKYCGLHFSETLASEIGVIFSDDGVYLSRGSGKSRSTLWVDFEGGANDHRRKYGGGRQQMLSKAVGLNQVPKLKILDATAGLGRDAFVMASLGAELTLIERNPVIHALLSDGLSRAQRSADENLVDIVSRMELIPNDAKDFLAGCTETFDTIYLDPMFPPRKKSAAVKKDMQLMHAVVGQDNDADLMLRHALDSGAKRIVVKRPKDAPCLTNISPHYVLKGKTSRFDIFALQRLANP